MDFKQSKRNKKRETWITIGLLISLFTGINFLISKINHTIDLSENSNYTLSDETKIRLGKMTTPVDIIITIPNNNKQPKIIQKLLHDLDLILNAFKYNKSKQKISVYKVDIDAARNSTKIIQKYNLTERNVILAITPSGQKKVLFRYNDLEGTNNYDSSKTFRSKDSLARDSIWESGFYYNWRESSNSVLEPTEFRGEEIILQSIIEIAGEPDNRNVAYFTRGHGEGSPSDVNPQNGFSELRRILEERNIKVSTIDLSTIERMPIDAKIIIIASPKATFQDQEISIIRDFINTKGGRLIVAIDPLDEISNIDRPAFGLREVLKEWGIRCHDMLVYDPQKENFDIFTGDYSLKTYSTENPHKIAKNLMEKGYSVQSNRIRPVEVYNKSSKDFSASEILFSSRSSWAVSSWANRAFPPQKNDLLDLNGPVPIVSVSERKKIQPNKYSQNGKIAVLGCSKILSNKRLKEHSGNRQLAQNIIYWLKGEELMLNISPKKLAIFNLTLNNSDFKKLLYLILIIPVAIAIVGVFVSWLRKEL